MDWIDILEKSIWFGFGALGFAVLFNVPTRTLLIIWILGAVGGTLKLIAMRYGLTIITGTLLGATSVGLLSIVAALNRNAPPLIFSIPAVIPMIPGVFIYKFILGVITLSGSADAENYASTLNHTVSFATQVIFILVSIAIGVSVPILVVRKKTSKVR